MAGRQRALMLGLWRVELGCTQVQGVGDHWQPQPAPHLPGHLSTMRGLENLSSPELPAGGETLAGSTPGPGVQGRWGWESLSLLLPLPGSAENRIALSESPLSDWLTK